MQLRILCCLPLVFALVMVAQTNRGSISGSVSDSSGAAIPGATVRIRNLSTNQAVSVQASHEGNFTAPALDPVEYLIEAKAAGFQTAVAKQVKVDTAGNTAVHFTLKPQSVETSVEVTAEGAAIQP